MKIHSARVANKSLNYSSIIYLFILFKLTFCAKTFSQKCCIMIRIVVQTVPDGCLINAKREDEKIEKITNEMR